jgi:tetrahydromethanopterin S-methyltransferase subunit B
MTAVNVTTTQNTVVVSDDGETVTILRGDVSSEAFTALEARVTNVENSFDGGTY